MGISGDAAKAMELTPEQDPTNQIPTADADSPSGSENGERPVRKKLQETDLDEAEQGTVDRSDDSHGPGAELNEARAKSSRKRSLEGKDIIDEQTTPSGIHTRKRSRDARMKGIKGHNAAPKSLAETAKGEIETAEYSGNESDRDAHSDVIATPLSSEDEAARQKGFDKRPKKKRSLDDMDIHSDSDRERKIAATDESRARRSSSEGPVDDVSRTEFVKELKDRKNRREANAADDKTIESGGEATKQQNLRDKDGSTQRPTKKRSRDALDEDFEREQKKTSSARQSRIKDSSEALDSLTQSRASKNGLAVAEETEHSKGKEFQGDSDELQSAAGPSMPTAEPLEAGRGPQGKSPVKKSAADSKSEKNAAAAASAITAQPKSPSETRPNDLPQTSAKAFASSGFAAMASQKSPFGTLGSQLSPSSSPFGAASPAKSGAETKSQPSEVLPQTSSSAFASSGFASMAGSTSPFGAAGSHLGSGESAFGSFAQSALKPTSGFGSSGTTAPGFGSAPSSVFGSGLGSGFGGGLKLSSFAAPVGDANLGGASDAKPFGAPADEEDNEDDEDAEDEDGGAADQRSNEDARADTDELSTAGQTEQSRKFKIRDGQYTLDFSYSRRSSTALFVQWSLILSYSQ